MALHHEPLQASGLHIEPPRDYNLQQQLTKSHCYVYRQFHLNSIRTTMKSIFAAVVLAAATLVAGLPSGCGQEHHPINILETAFQPPEICWRACFYKEPKCPVGLHASKLGDCWTCCVDEE